MMKSCKLAGFAFILSILLLGCGADNPGSDAMLLSGSIEAREVDIGFQVGGRLKHINVEEGDLIKTAQLIADIDDQDYQLSLQKTKYETEAAKAVLTALQNGTRQQELQVAEAELDQVQAQVRFTESEIKRVAVLLAEKMAPDEALEKAQLEFEHALATEDAVKHKLNLLKEGPRLEDIQRAEAQYKAMLSAVELAKKKLNDTQLYSPLTGYVSVKMAEAGEVLTPGQPVVKITELSKPWVRAYLTEPYLGRVKLGQKLEVKVDGLEKSFKGTLSYISPKAEFTPKNVETQELRTDLVYRIKVLLENPDGELKIGMPADILLPLSGS